MTTNLHDKMLAAIDAYFSASNEIEAHVAEEQLLDVRDELLKHPAQTCSRHAEAERLADHLEKWNYAVSMEKANKAAAELRRLVSFNQQLMDEVARLQKREWVELTFAEICECENDYLHLFARAIEAKLKEKNHA